MDDRAKTIQKLEQLENLLLHYDAEFYEHAINKNGYAGWLHIALTYLREQEPVKPIRRVEGLDVCGYCKRPVYRSLCERFCPGCGKRVLWDE